MKNPEVRIGECFSIVNGSVTKYLDITVEEGMAKALLEEIDLQVGIPAGEPKTVMGKIAIELQKILEKGDGENV